jgi:hypothetical protein
MKTQLAGDLQGPGMPYFFAIFALKSFKSSQPQSALRYREGRKE